ncbi:hypothetical protein Tco_1282005 [Tanacetum coccineum]
MSYRKGVVIKEIKEDNVVDEDGKKGKLLLEWHDSNELEKEGNPIESSTNKYERKMDRRTSDAFTNLLEEIEFELEHGSEIVKEKLSQEKFSQKEISMELEDELFQQDNAVDWQKDPYHYMDEDQEIAHMLIKLHQANDDVVFQNNDLEEPVVEPVVV